MLQKATSALARSFELPQQTTPDARGTQRRFRGLRIGALGLLVAHDCGGEIIEEARICPLPRAPAWLRGLINVRGRLTPAFDLHEALGVTRLRSAKQWWLTLGAGDEALAFTIDALPASLLVREASPVQPGVAPERLRAHTGAAYCIDGELWLQFDHRKFFRALGSSCGPTHF